MVRYTQLGAEADAEIAALRSQLMHAHGEYAALSRHAATLEEEIDEFNALVTTLRRQLAALEASHKPCL